MLEDIKRYSLSVLYNDNSLNKTVGELEKVFNVHFFDKYGIETTKILKKYINSNELSLLQYYYFGIFTGIIFVLIFLSILISKNFDIDMDDDKAFKQIFPMFRGIFIVGLYLWILVLNTFLWNSNNISYKIVFKFANHVSSLVAQMKRAASLLTITFLMVLVYLIQRVEIAKDVLSWVYFIPLNMTPLICWMGFLLYLFCPFQSIFNYEGRMYLFNTIILCFKFCPEFPCIWLGDQFISLSGLIRDFSYTVCYYFHYDDDYLVIKDSCNPNSFPFLVLSLIPAFIRIGTCINICLTSKKLYPQSLNAGKYLCSVIAAYFSYLFSKDEHYFHWWLLWAFISGSYSFIWDLKMDWGFMEPKSKNFMLRDKLVLKNTNIYYVSIFWDFIFRYFFVLTISPHVVYSFIRPEFLTMLILSAEVIRRGLWNTIRVEFRHIEVCKDFRSTLFVETPFYEDENGVMRVKSFTSKQDLDRVNVRLNKIKDTGYLYRKKQITAEDFLKRLEDPKHYDYFVHDIDDKESLTPISFKVTLKSKSLNNDFDENSKQEN